MMALTRLQERAELLGRLRLFFAQKGVLEVETPLLVQAPNLDDSIQPMQLGSRFLITSPEFHMKRLLAEGSGSIYQICKVFRDEEAGDRHNPEFTLLEFYLVGLDDRGLMDFVAELLQTTLGWPAAERISYLELFQRFAGVNPFSLIAAEFVQATQGIPFPPDLLESGQERARLDFLMGFVIEPKLGQSAPVFVYDYPAAQAALARLDPANPTLARRFELYYQGVELGNGYWELNQAQEQRQRFESTNQARQAAGLNALALDEAFLGIVDRLPPCAGIALGVDRLLMVAKGYPQIKKALSFDWERA